MRADPQTLHLATQSSAIPFRRARQALNNPRKGKDWHDGNTRLPVQGLRSLNERHTRATDRETSARLGDRAG